MVKLSYVVSTIEKAWLKPITYWPCTLIKGDISSYISKRDLNCFSVGHDTASMAEELYMLAAEQ